MNTELQDFKYRADNLKYFSADIGENLRPDRKKSEKDH